MTGTDPPRAGRTLLRSALSLAARGWHVFPCAPGTKHPALRASWQHLATTDPARIARWWARAPFNIAIACGPSGLVIIDLDTARDAVVPGAGQPANGADSLAALCRQHGQPYPDATFTVATTSGGRHLYFTAARHQVRNSAGRLGHLIDIRAAGGYVIAPGSRVAGRVYTAQNTAIPMPLPDWIADMLSQQPEPPGQVRPPPCPGSRGATAYATAALRAETRRMAAAEDGTRHDTLNKAAFSLGQLAGAGLLPEPDVVTALAAAARQSGLPERDILRIIRSGMAAGARHPRKRRAGSAGPASRPPASQ